MHMNTMHPKMSQNCKIKFHCYIQDCAPAPQLTSQKNILHFVFVHITSLKYPKNAKNFKLPADIYAGIDDEENDVM